jgi:hypothetical protein
MSYLHELSCGLGQAHPGMPPRSPMPQLSRFQQHNSLTGQEPFHMIGRGQSGITTPDNRHINLDVFIKGGCLRGSIPDPWARIGIEFHAFFVYQRCGNLDPGKGGGNTSSGYGGSFQEIPPGNSFRHVSPPFGFQLCCSRPQKKCAP